MIEGFWGDRKREKIRVVDEDAVRKFWGRE